MKNWNVFIVLIVFLACSQEPQNSSNDSTSKTFLQPQDLVGRTIEYRYGESVYHVTIDSDHEMHWEAMAGDEKGVKEEETYKIEKVNDTQFFITWGEANGIGVSQILDFENGTVYNHLLRGRDISMSRGEIRLLEKAE